MTRYYRKGSVRYLWEERGWLATFSSRHYAGSQSGLYATFSLAMSEYREHDRKVRESLMARSPKATPRAVLTTDGIILRGDSDHREGDPIINPRTGKVHYIASVDPSTIVETYPRRKLRPAGQDAELPLFFD